MLKLIKVRTSLALSSMALSVGLITSNSALACSGSEPMLGSMCVFAGNFAPRGYALANGQLLPISQYTALFSLLGTTYGGDGRTTFALPDARGRSLIGSGSGTGLSTYRLGQKGGVESVTLSVNQIPSHTHSVSVDVTATVNAHNGIGSSSSPSGGIWSSENRTDVYSTEAPDVTMSPEAISTSVEANLGNTGGGQSHENRPPYLAVNWLIALQGIFPSRN